MDRLFVKSSENGFEFSADDSSGEEVRQIVGFTGYYISNKGRVFCALGKGSHRIGRYVSPYVILGRDTIGHYLRVYAREDATNRRKDLYVHRLVGTYFLQKRECATVINHKNCDRHDNRVENLEWCTVRENLTKAIESGHLVRNKINGRMESNFDYKTCLSERRK